MNKTLIQNIIHRTLEGTISFPEVVSALVSEGITSYHVDLIRNENTYYSAQDHSWVENVPLSHAAAVKEFSTEGVQNAIRKSQAGKSNYKQFVSEILEAGCVYYIAYLRGRKVEYIGRDGTVYIETFPQSK